MVLVILSLPALSLLFLQNKQVQTQLTKYLAERVSEELQAQISLSSISYSFFRRVQVRDLYIEDLHGDTLIYAELTKLRIKQFRPEPKGLTIRKITLENGFVNLVIDSSRVVNIKHFTDYLKNPHNPPELKPVIHIASIDLENTRFSLSRMGAQHGAQAIDFNDFHLHDIQVTVENLEVRQDTVRMEVIGLDCVEQSGFHIQEINTQLSINRSFMHFDDLEVRTPESDLDIPRLWFDFGRFRDFRRFSYRVDLDFISRESQLHMMDLKQFAPVPGTILDDLVLDGRVSGKLNQLQGDDMLLNFADRSELAFDFTMFGLPHFSSTFMDFRFKELNTRVEAVSKLVSNVRDSARDLSYPWKNLGQLAFQGRFTGYPDQFVASGLLRTDMGRIVMDLNFEPDSIRGTDFLGRLRTADFQLGTFLDREEELDDLDMNVYARGSLENGQIRAELRGSIDTLDLYSYAYSNITLDGAITNNTFDGGFSVSDPNIELTFDGRTDFSGQVPVHRFKANVIRLRPHFLNLAQSDPDYFMSFLVDIDLQGKRLDELNGEVALVNSLFKKSDEQIQLYDVKLSMRNTPEASLIRLRSEVMDFDLTGQYQLSTLPASFKNLADYFLDVDREQVPYQEQSNYFNYQVAWKKMNRVLEFFLPVISMGDDSRMSGRFNPSGRHMETNAFFPYLELDNFRWHRLNAQLNSDTAVFDARIQADSLRYGDSYALEQQSLHFMAGNDTAFMGIRWDNQALPAFRGQLDFHGKYEQAKEEVRAFRVKLDEGAFVVRDLPWNVKEASALVYRDSLHLKDVEFSGGERLIQAYGLLSRADDQDFHLRVQNLVMDRMPGLNSKRLKVKGKLTGSLDYQKVEGVPLLLTNMRADSLRINEQYLGQTELQARWNEQQRRVMMLLESVDGGSKIVESSGTFTPEDQALDFNIRVSEFSLEALEPFAQGLAHDLAGTAHINLSLDGTLKAPELNGNLSFTGAAGTLDYLNTRYYFEDQIRIYHNNVYMEDFRFDDGQGHQAVMNGAISNNYLKDFYINLNIDARNMLCLNTRSVDNEVFYGTIYGSGNVAIRGEPGRLGLNINARTEGESELALPLYNASEVTTHDFITFISEKDRALQQEEERKEASRIDLDMEVEISNNAVVRLIFDPKVGDIIETRGTGTVRMISNRNDGFRMFGDVRLTEGDYLFTLQNVINKRFRIEPGGIIAFNGAALDASVDLEAIYNLRAAPYNLYPDNDEQKEKLKKRIPVECHLILEGALGSPTITTGINMPTADAQTRSLLENSTSTDEELMRQFLSLLVINNFYSVSGYGGQEIGAPGSIAGVTASELLSNQLSNWLSQISDDFDIGINYRPGDEVTQDEVELALSTQLLNDRVIISGNVDVGGQETNPPEGSNNPYVMGDFDVEFRWTDNISIFAFNRARDELLYETAPYKQGVGISYREEFDNLAQLMNRYREARTNRKKKRKKEGEAKEEE